MDRDSYPTILHIDIDAFFASVEEAICPALKGKPVIVGGLATDRGVVACPNYEARRLGVRTAMPLARARLLAPGAVYVRGDHGTYEKYSHRFIEILRSFSPVVQPVSLDEAYLDANGCLHLWDCDPGKMAAAIKQAVFEELRITVSVGISSNRVCSKVASDYSKKLAKTGTAIRGETGPPDGLLIVPLGEERNFLAPLPVSALPGIGRKTAEALESLGISTIGNLADSDAGVLTKIFGVIGLYLHEAANGRGSSELDDGERAAKSISKSTTFSEDSNDANFISAVLFHFAEKIARSLRRSGEVASTITLKMRYSQGAPAPGFRYSDPGEWHGFVTYQKSYTLGNPTNSEFEIASTAMELFKKLWLKGTKVRLVGIGVTNIRRDERQTELFLSGRDRRGELLKRVDIIREKFGYHSIYFGIVERLQDKSDGRGLDVRHAAPAGQTNYEG